MGVREDWPLAVGDTVQDKLGETLTFIDYPTGGPLFITEDGLYRQYERDDAETLL